MARDIRGAVVVITGASSGIGRCAPVRFDRCGSRLVLAVRESAALSETVARCESQGARVVAIPPCARRGCGLGPRASRGGARRADLVTDTTTDRPETR